MMIFFFPLAPLVQMERVKSRCPTLWTQRREPSFLSLSLSRFFFSLVLAILTCLSVSLLLPKGRGLLPKTDVLLLGLNEFCSVWLTIQVVSSSRNLSSELLDIWLPLWPRFRGLCSFWPPWVCFFWRQAPVKKRFKTRAIPRSSSPMGSKVGAISHFLWLCFRIRGFRSAVGIEQYVTRVMFIIRRLRTR